MEILVVGLGGALGAICRYLASMIKIKWDFPIPTLLINVVGSFLIGFISAWALKNHQENTLFTLFVKVGICGGFTTFSTFSLENLTLIQSGQTMQAILYMILSFSLSLCAVFLGGTLIK